VMQARVFPTCPSVLRELGDRQRLRMLTAVGTPKDSQAQPSATPTLTYGEGELLTYMLGPDLDRLFSPKDRQVGAPRLASPPKVCETSPSRQPLILKVIVDEATPLPGSSARRHGWPRRPDFVDLGPKASRAGSTLTFKISARRLLYDGSLPRTP
jgi:hypothetical protein